MPENVAANIAAGVAAKANPAPAKAEVAKAPAGAVPAVADPNAGKEKYVVEGREVYLSPDQAKAYVQKGLAFEPKISQLGRLQQETASFLDTLAKDPAKILYNEKFGQPEEVLAKILNSTKVSEKIKEALGQWYYKNVVQLEEMSPEQRRSKELEDKVATYEREKQAVDDSRTQQENDARTQRALAEIKAGISEAMKDAGVAMDSKIAPQLAKRVAQIMQLGFVNGKVVTPKEAMAKVKQEIFEYQKAYYDVLDEDKLVEQIGKENAEKVRKYFLKQVKDANKVKPGVDHAPKRDDRKTMSPDEFRDYLDGLKRGK